MVYISAAPTKANLHFVWWDGSATREAKTNLHFVWRDGSGWLGKQTFLLLIRIMFDESPNDMQMMYLLFSYSVHIMFIFFHIIWVFSDNLHSVWRKTYFLTPYVCLEREDTALRWHQVASSRSKGWTSRKLRQRSVHGPARRTSIAHVGTSRKMSMRQKILPVRTVLEMSERRLGNSRWGRTRSSPHWLM